jgi:hypothetical protein
MLGLQLLCISSGEAGGMPSQVLLHMRLMCIDLGEVKMWKACVQQYLQPVDKVDRKLAPTATPFNQLVYRSTRSLLILLVLEDGGTLDSDRLCLVTVLP